MLKLDLEEKKKIDSLQVKLNQGEWFEAASSAASVLENILWKIHRELINKLPPKKQKEIIDSISVNKPIDRLTLGERITLFRNLDLFKLYSDEIEKRPLPSLQLMDWDKILKIRNSVAHPREFPASAEQAYEISSALYLVALETTDWKPHHKVAVTNNPFFKKALIFIALFISILTVMYILITSQDIQNTKKLLSEHGEEVSLLLEKRGAYSLAIWAIKGDKLTKSREVLLYRFYKLLAQEVKNYDPVQSYRLYDAALDLEIVGDKSSVKEWQEDLWQKMTPIDQIRAKNPTIDYVIPGGFIGLIVFYSCLKKRQRKYRSPD